MNKTRKNVILNNEISEVRSVSLGGYDQKIMLDGKSGKNPIVICLHGGPGSPVPFSVGCRGLFPEITDKLTLVCWDQLGCGINNRPIDNSFKISDFVHMTEDLAGEIRRLFPENKLYLFGISWGSVLAALAAAGGNVRIDGAITYGQVLYDLTFNEEVFTALENSEMPESKKKKLAQIKESRNMKNTVQIMNYIGKYTEGYVCRSSKTAPLIQTLKGLRQSPDYRFRDFAAVMINGYKKNSSLINELVGIDLREALSKIKIPYKIIQGDTDLVTSTRAIERFLSENANENIGFVKIENSGHMPGEEAMIMIIGEIFKMCGI